MWAMITTLLMRLAALRWFLKLGGLGLLVPIAFLLKVIGLPIFAVLSILALPVLLLLFVFGLPIFLVLIAGGMAMGLLAMVLTIGVAAVKVGLFVVLPIVLIVKLVRWIFKRRGGGSATDTPPASDPPPPPTDNTMHASEESRANPVGDPLSGPISDL
jgi:hypothetical protein